MTTEYLLFNALIFFSPNLGLLLYRKGRWPRIWPAMVAIASISTPYLIWDAIVTNRWWWFNPLHTLGWKVGPLPIEEILFFITVPWSCLVIWENLRTVVHGRWSVPIERVLSVLAVMSGAASIVYSKWYTLCCAIIVVLLSAYSAVQGNWLQQRRVAVFFGMVFALILVFNGYLTARPVVSYADKYLSTLRIGTIPVEDVVYGLVLVGAIALVYDRVRGNTSDASTPL